MIRGKRELVSNVCAATGATWLVERLPRKPVLMILNYHRVGDPGATEYDPGLFSCSAEEFDWQIAYLKRHYRMTTLDEVLGLLGNGARLTEPRVLITFDDGYIDNYQFAFPVLRRHGVQGVFFLPTAFTGTNRIPWWDSIAYIVKHSRHRQFRIEYPQAGEFDLDADGAAQSIMRILKLYKQPAMRDHDRFVGDLERACDCSRPGAGAERCFLGWDEARQMQRGGMAFGSHTHNHEILSKLPATSQLEELRRSREILESELQQKIETLAYPVGARDTFSPETWEALRLAKYRAAFSFYNGFNKPGTLAPFDLQRCAMEPLDRGRLRLQTALGSLTGSVWF
jgi:peptidoglycan/xylan/chitin deacetylase (PgdA/CDA1 family)